MKTELCPPTIILGRRRPTTFGVGECDHGRRVQSGVRFARVDLGARGHRSKDPDVSKERRVRLAVGRETEHVAVEDRDGWRVS